MRGRVCASKRFQSERDYPYRQRSNDSLGCEEPHGWVPRL